MASLQCPLSRQTFITLEKPMGLQHVLKIEEHVATNSSDCPHLPLKDIFFNKPIRGSSSPLLLACYYGELASVERIVEHWKVDVNQAAIYYYDPFKKGLLSFCFGKVTPLFVAADNGHDDVVRYLVGKGASLPDETSDEEDLLKALRPSMLERVASMLPPQCPLSRKAFLNTKKRLRLEHIHQIEEHVAASSPDCPHPPLKDIVFNDIIKGSSLLLMACYYGQLDSMERIVEHWEVDVNLAATYYVYPLKNWRLSHIKIEKATPLFVAAACGHADIVRFLVRKGADVSAKTSDQDDTLCDGLTPLYGALFIDDDDCYVRDLQNSTIDKERENRSDIVRFLLESGAKPSIEDISRPSDGNPMWTSTRWCGIEAITALIAYGMDLNHPTPSGLTILNHWAGRPTTEEESLAVVKLLVERGADLNVKGDSGFSPITNAAYRQNLVVLDFLLERSDVCRMEKIDALELAGAVILSDAKHAALFPKAIGYWRRSLQLRLEDTPDGYGPIVKTPSKHLESWRVVEWATSDELENVIQHRTAQEIQSFLIKSRILCATKNWESVQSLFLIYIDYDSSSTLWELLDQGKFTDRLSIALLMLETIRRFDPKEKGLWLTTLKVVGELNRLLGELEESKDPLLDAKLIEKSLELMLATDQFHLNDRKHIYKDSHLQDYMYSLFDLIETLAGQPQLMNENSMKSLSELVSRDQRRRPKKKSSLLHMACELLHKRVHGLATIDLLLRTGADPNAGDCNGNGPLHVLADPKVGESYGIYGLPFFVLVKLMKNPDDINAAAARLLLAEGSHLDRVNNNGKTAADVWIERQYCFRSFCESSGYQEVDPKMSDLPTWLRPDDPVPKLKCLCAQVIRSKGAHYKHLLPPSLQLFVSWHKLSYYWH